jgi:long-chain acyl-CoA synthetase
VPGYWNRPEANAETFTDGWVHTGDIATADDEGFVSIVDRAKDVIIRGGENVSSLEVEAALYEHPAVLDVAVIAVPHETLGETVGAAVRLRPATAVDEEGLRVHAASLLAPYKVPSQFWLIDEEFPRSPTGKLLKREMKANLLAEGR